jgi:hypothetical protein
VIVSTNLTITEVDPSNEIVDGGEFGFGNDEGNSMKYHAKYIVPNNGVHEYAYLFNIATQQFQEWVTGTTWQGDDSQFFWTTNYWQSAANIGLFWETNNNPGATGDPIRYSDGTTWTTFDPILHPDASATKEKAGVAVWRQGDVEGGPIAGRCCD